MVLHIMGATMYTKDFYTFICENFSDTKPVFVNRLKKSTPEFTDMFSFQGDYPAAIVSPVSFKFIKNVYKCDAIIFHALFNLKYLLFFAFQPWLLKKCNWIIWGGDIYGHNKDKKTIKDKIYEKLKRGVCLNIGYVTTLTDKDYNLLKEWYGYSGKHFDAKYPTPLTRIGVEQLLCERRLEKQDSEHRPIKIMIGNSATVSNQHFQAIDFLKQFKNENIKIYLPLSYGMIENYIEYGDKVITYAQEKLGEEKIIPIRERMDGTNYVDLISQMDVGIFNCNRQQAMGNISILFAVGAKVYIRTDTAMWEHYISRGNIVYDIDNIPKIEFSEFWRADEKASAKNIDIIQYNTSVELNKRRWGYIFDEMLSKKM